MSSIKSDKGFTIYWRIENFFCNPGKYFCIKSPEFKIKILNSNWYLEVSQGLHAYVRIYLFKQNYSEEPVSCCDSFFFSILTDYGWITTDDKPYYTSNYVCADLLSLENLNKEEVFHLPTDSLTISIHVRNGKANHETSQSLLISKVMSKSVLHHRPIRYFTDLNQSDMLSFLPTYDSGEKTSFRGQKTKEFKTQFTQTDTHVDFKDIKELLEFKGNEFNFVTIRTSSERFTVHKAVLCTKSPVFKAMFESKKKGNNCSIIDITDVDSETMSLFINFLHSQPFGVLSWESAAKLHYAADKYQVNALKKECVAIFQKELSVENVCDAFLLADLNQNKDFMSCAQEYFCKNLKAILLSKQWKDLLLSHTQLASDILCKFAEKM